MTYYVKRCARCGAVNHPAEVQCIACADLLPIEKIASDNAPPNPSERATRAALRANTQKLAPGANTTPSDPVKVIITDIRLPFWSVFDLVTRIILASIPAAAFAAFIIFSIVFFLVALIGGPFHR